MITSDTDNKPVVFIATSTAFAINAFFEPHIYKLAETFDLVVVSDNGNHQYSKGLEKVSSFENVQIKRQPSFWHDIKVITKFFFLIRKHKPKCVITMTPKVGLFFALVGALCKVQVRVHIITGQVWQNYTGFKRQFFKLLDRVLIALTTRTLADSRSQIEYLIDQGVLTNEGVEVLGNGSVAGVDTDIFQPNPELRSRIRRKHGVSDKELIVFFLGRMVSDKGIFDAVEAMGRVSEELCDVRFWCAGPDEANVSSELQRLALTKNLNFKYFGKVKTTFDLFCSSDLFVLPSKREGFGAVVIEAAACCLPTVAYRTYGVMDAISDNETGLLADYCDVEDLATKMLILLKDEARLKKYGVAGRSRVIDLFKQNIPVDYLETVIKEEFGLSDVGGCQSSTCLE